MNLGDIRDAIETWITGVTGLRCDWAERPQRFGATRMLLHLRGSRGFGHDEISEDYDAATVLGPAWGDIVGGITPTQTGQRSLTLEVRCETQSQDDDLDAMYYVQLVRDGMSLPGVVDVLDAAECAIGDILMEPRELSFTGDLRRVSSAQMDLALNAASAVAGTPYGTIESAEVTFTGVDEDGATVFEETVTLEA
uniref:Uncharacterized protein n=1 Tax=viral metagenome TaxID=1070528 RepID=A0A6M3JLP9_9ZZZZ